MHITIKLNLKLWGALLVGCGVLAAAYLGISLTQRPGAVITSGQLKQVTFSGKNTAQSRLEFLQALGWQVEEEPIEVAEVVIPQEFDTIYIKYNDLQKEAGLDLAPYAGQKVKRYSYRVINYVGQPDGVRVNLLLYKNKLIGGDICSVRLDGFMHCLRGKEETQ